MKKFLVSLAFAATIYSLLYLVQTFTGVANPDWSILVAYFAFRSMENQLELLEARGELRTFKARLAHFKGSLGPEAFDREYHARFVEEPFKEEYERALREERAKNEVLRERNRFGNNEDGDKGDRS